MSISKRKLKANRENAQRSTGPRTNESRETVSQNRTTHGLCGRFQVLPSEDQREYDDLLERFLRAEQPADDVERELVAKMARHPGWPNAPSVSRKPVSSSSPSRPSSKRATASPAPS